MYVFLKGDSCVDYLDGFHDILHQEDGLQLRQNVVQPADRVIKIQICLSMSDFMSSDNAFFDSYKCWHGVLFTQSFKLYKSGLERESMMINNVDCHWTD